MDGVRHSCRAYPIPFPVEAGAQSKWIVDESGPAVGNESEVRMSNDRECSCRVWPLASSSSSASDVDLNELGC
jgi:hypothetical protein